MPPPISGQVSQSPVSNPGQPFPVLPDQPNQVPPGHLNHMLPGQSSQILSNQQNQAPAPSSQMPLPQPSQLPSSQPSQMVFSQPNLMPSSHPNQMPSGQSNQTPHGHPSQMPRGQPNQMSSSQVNRVIPGQPNQMAPGGPLYSVPGPSPSQPYEAQPMIQGQPQQTQRSDSSQPYQIPMSAAGPTYEISSQNTSQAYQFPAVNSVSALGGSAKPGVLRQSSQQYQATPYPGQPYQMPASNPDQFYQPQSLNPSQLYPGQPVQSPLPPSRTSQAYQTPTSAPGQPYQVRPYQPSPQNQGQGPPQPNAQTMQATGPGGYQAYQTPGQVPNQVQPSGKPPIPSVVGAATSQLQQQQQVMPPSPVQPKSPGAQSYHHHHHPYQNNYNYSSPHTQSIPGNRTVKQENQGYGPTPVGQPLQMIDGRTQSYAQTAPSQATQWAPPFANPSPTSVYSHTSPYPGAPPVSYATEQSMMRQSQPQHPPPGYPPNSYAVGSGYTNLGQQPGFPGRQPYAQSAPQMYGSGYHQPEPRSQYTTRRSPLSDAKINSIDTLLCHAEELEPRVLSFSGTRGQLNIVLSSF